MSELLIVDDDNDLSEMLQEALELHGHHTRRAVNGVRGLEEVQAHIPDAIVLDVEMPELDGPAMALAMYLHDKGLEHVPIVLVSGIVGLPAIAKRVGTPYYLEKPYSLDQVTDLCDRALAERRSPHPAVAQPHEPLDPGTMAGR